MTNTIPLKASAKSNEKIVQLSVAPLLAEAIKRGAYSDDDTLTFVIVLSSWSA